MSDSMDSPDQSHSPTSTYWSRQLMKVEENDPYRLAWISYQKISTHYNVIMMHKISLFSLRKMFSYKLKY